LHLDATFKGLLDVVEFLLEVILSLGGVFLELNELLDDSITFHYRFIECGDLVLDGILPDLNVLLWVLFVSTLI